ncbi:helix-turn-helix domain-containing protein, partial [Anaerococcus sp. AGMB00486]
MKKIIDEKTKKEIYELEKARKNTNNKKEEVRLKAMILKLQGVTTREISEKLDVAMSTIFEWLRKYKKSSIDGLKNKKRIGNNRNLT